MPEKEKYAPILIPAAKTGGPELNECSTTAARAVASIAATASSASPRWQWASTSTYRIVWGCGGCGARGGAPGAGEAGEAGAAPGRNWRAPRASSPGQRFSMYIRIGAAM